MTVKLVGSSSGSVALAAPASTTSGANIEFKLPVADGSANQFLKTDGSGQLSFTQNLNSPTLTGHLKSGDTDPFIYSYKGGSDGQVRSGFQLDGTNQQILAYTGTNERIRIDSTGGLRVGHTANIFNTASSEKASIKQSATGHALTLQSTDITGGYPVLWLYSTDTTASQNAVIFQRTGGSVGTITTSASSTAYNTSSDYRLKENEVAISDGITRLKTLKPYRFNWKVDPDTKVDGFFAHEVTAVPEAVTGTKDEVSTDENGAIPKGDPVYQSIDLSKLVPLLTAALQEAVAKIETLETKVAALEAK